MLCSYLLSTFLSTNALRAITFHAFVFHRLDIIMTAHFLKRNIEYFFKSFIKNRSFFPICSATSARPARTTGASATPPASAVPAPAKGESSERHRAGDETKVTRRDETFFPHEIYKNKKVKKFLVQNCPFCMNLEQVSQNDWDFFLQVLYFFSNFF